MLNVSNFDARSPAQNQCYLYSGVTNVTAGGLRKLYTCSMKHIISAKSFAVLFSMLFFASSFFSQTAPFEIYVEPMNIAGLGGLQAFSFGQANGKWLIVGGRLDGLHRRQPFAAFDVAGNNNQLIVVDPSSGQKWTASLNTLSVSLQEQLSATNMEFHQKDNYLYIIGGYGYNATSASRLTFAQLTAIDVPGLIAAIVAGNPIASYFRQINDAEFAVTGGHLKMINNTYYLIGGNKFDGNYNPMGNPTYTQVYTNAIRKFTLADNGTAMTITHLPSITDAANLHRRDYNAVPQIMPSGEEGVTAFSGVFQATVDLPFLNCVNIDSVSYSVNNSFQQFYNHYHCAVVPIYSASNNEMHSVFFGGIAQYYDNAGTLVQDNNVPFVNTIARVTRTGAGIMSEYKLPVEMPSLLGASAEFIPLKNVPQYNNEVFKLDNFLADSTLVGYIYGGISSTAANVFFTNTGTQSSASNTIFKVYVIKKSTVGLNKLNAESVSKLQVQVSPHPNSGIFDVRYQVNSVGLTRFKIQNAEGKEIVNHEVENQKMGENTVSFDLRTFELQGMFYLTVENGNEKVSRKIILSRGH